MCTLSRQRISLGVLLLGGVSLLGCDISKLTDVTFKVSVIKTITIQGSSLSYSGSAIARFDSASSDYAQYRAKIKDITLDSLTCQITRNNSVPGAIGASDLKVGDLSSTASTATLLGSVPGAMLSDSSVKSVKLNDEGVSLAVALAEGSGVMLFYVTGTSTAAPLDFDVELVLVWKVTAEAS